MSKMCHVIEDLLPLYTEAMVHEDTANFIKDHLDNCEQCSAKYQSMIHSSKMQELDQKLEEQRILEKNVLSNAKKEQRRRTRKKVLLIGLIVLLLAVGYCVNKEMHYATYEMVDMQLSKEQIVKECPEILITDTDRALGAFILNRPETEALYAQMEKEGKAVTMPHEDLENMFSEWPMNERDHLSGLTATAYQDHLIFGYYCEADKRLYYYYTFAKGQEAPIEKVIAVYKDVMVSAPAELKAIYENREGELRKYIPKRQWFAWLLDR